jgi:hypothetical protein
MTKNKVIVAGNNLGKTGKPPDLLCLNFTFICQQGLQKMELSLNITSRCKTGFSS